MTHLIYCDNTGKKGEKVLDKILDGQKNYGGPWYCRAKNSSQQGF